MLVRCQGTKSAIRNDIPVRSSPGALALSMPILRRYRRLDGSSTWAESSQTRRPPTPSSSSWPQPPDSGRGVQRPAVPGREHVPDAATAVDGGLHRQVQTFNGGYKEIRIRPGVPDIVASDPRACAGSPPSAAKSCATVPIRPLVAMARFVPLSFAMSR